MTVFEKGIRSGGVRLRADLAGLPPYRTGRDAPSAVKLSSNESAHRPLPGVMEEAARALERFNRYPDTASSALLEALAARLGCRTDQLAVGPGSSPLCQHLVTATAGPGDEVLYGWRSFDLYPVLVTLAGATSVRAPLAGASFDVDALGTRLSGRTRLVFLCNPNNPTGTAIGRDAVTRFLDAAPPDCLVVLDEAYREYVTDPEVPDGLDLLPDHPNLVVVRTFSKAYGLAGLRVGYCVANEEVISMVRRVQLPFAVTGVAQAAALASLGAEAELMTRVDEVVAERDRVRAALVALGYDVPESQANFVWLALGEGTAGFAAGCEDRGVLVRPFGSDGVRVTIGSPPENDAFLAAAADRAGAR